VKFSSAKSGRLKRAGKTVARGSVVNRRAQFVSRTRIAKGTYTLVAGKRALRVQVR